MICVVGAMTLASFFLTEGSCFKFQHLRTSSPVLVPLDLGMRTDFARTHVLKLQFDSYSFYNLFHIHVLNRILLLVVPPVVFL